MTQNSIVQIWIMHLWLLFFLSVYHSMTPKNVARNQCFALLCIVIIFFFQTSIKMRPYCSGPMWIFVAIYCIYSCLLYVIALIAVSLSTIYYIYVVVLEILVHISLYDDHQKLYSVFSCSKWHSFHSDDNFNISFCYLLLLLFQFDNFFFFHF